MSKQTQKQGPRKAGSITLGLKYRDTIHEFEGIATARTEFIWGCDRISLETIDKQNGDVRTTVFDILQLEEVKEVKQAKVPATPEIKTGGPGDPVPQASALSR